MGYFVFVVLALAAILLAMFVVNVPALIIMGPLPANAKSYKLAVLPAISGVVAGLGLYLAARIAINNFSPLDAKVLLGIACALTLLMIVVSKNYKVMVPVQLAVVIATFIFLL
ncbi:MAG: hypothetical protein H0W44_04420 [Gammaproteobacteria bacterium]|nr:hypothetical protein [Gammaproteobacteria bacterium]